MQETAYAKMFEERYQVPINNLVIIAAVDGSDEPEVYTSKRDKHILQMREMVTEYMENRK